MAGCRQTIQRPCQQKLTGRIFFNNPADRLRSLPAETCRYVLSCSFFFLLFFFFLLRKPCFEAGKPIPPERTTFLLHLSAASSSTASSLMRQSRCLRCLRHLFSLAAEFYAAGILNVSVNHSCGKCIRTRDDSYRYSISSGGAFRHVEL